MQHRYTIEQLLTVHAVQASCSAARGLQRCSPDPHRACASDLESVPQLGQVAWSRQIAYDADWVLAMGRKQNSDALECAFRKNRHGFLGDFIMFADFDKGKFEEIDDPS